MTTQKQKIVITGAPSSGKSTTMQLIRRDYSDRIVVVPESAAVLLAGGFPAPAHDDLEQIRAFQLAIIQTHISLEEIFSKQNPEINWMLLDRALVDGAGFWPEGPESYFKEFKIDPEKEFARYDFVLFFELPDKSAFGGVNNLRFHNYEQSLESEKRLQEVWREHPRFIEITATADFDEKIQSAVAVINEITR